MKRQQQKFLGIHNGRTHETRGCPEGVEFNVRAQQRSITGERAPEEKPRGALLEEQSLVQDQTGSRYVEGKEQI